MHEQLIKHLRTGDARALARAISFVENEASGYDEILLSLRRDSSATVIGVTGPPGAGKSTIVDGMIGELLKEQGRIAVLCVDPSSPFNLGAVLGDRIRMSEWYTHPNVFIRSLATRGSVGGLSPKIIEVTDLLRSCGFDNIIVETVGVGQSEIEIAALADITVVVLVPESGDEVQTMKAGLMEIADIFVINKSDRPDADLFEKNLQLLLAPAFGKRSREVPVIRTIATEKKGIPELVHRIKNDVRPGVNEERRIALLTEKAWQLMAKQRMREVDKLELRRRVEKGLQNHNLNIYSLVADYK